MLAALHARAPADKNGRLDVEEFGGMLRQLAPTRQAVDFDAMAPEADLCKILSRIFDLFDAECVPPARPPARYTPPAPPRSLRAGRPSRLLTRCARPVDDVRPTRTLPH